MAINKQTIISAFDDKLTLLQWLKTINKALDEAVLTGVEVRQKGNATYSFVVTFEDGTELESNEFILAQGESINGATIRNGHLYLTLTNDEELDAGNVKPVTSFEINASQHLIVNYDDGTSQDLGAIFSGNVNVDGNFTANSIVENMDSGYSFIPNSKAQENGFVFSYAGIVKNGNKLTLAIAGTFTRNENTPYNTTVGGFIIPTEVYNKLFTNSLNNLGNKAILLFSSAIDYVEIPTASVKGSNNIVIDFYKSGNIPVVNKTYAFRYEETFLLSDNLAG